MMKNPSFPFLTSLPIVAILALSGASLTGCGSEEEVVETPAPPRSTAPTWSVADIQMDLKVQFPEKYQPGSEPLAQAIADFASAMARGDHAAFGSLLAASDLNFLRNFLIPSGQWRKDTEDIRAVRVVNIQDGESIAQVAIAVGTSEEAYLTAWRAERVDGTTWKFSAIPVAPRTTSRVALLDDASFDEDLMSWLQAWSAANAPEDIYEDQYDFDIPAGGEEGDDGSGLPPSTPPRNPGGPSGPSGPSGPGSPLG